MPPSHWTGSSDAGKLERLVDRATLRLAPRRQRPLHIRRIVLAMEPKHPSKEALAWATELGVKLGASVSVLSVVQHPKHSGYYYDGAAPLELKEDELAHRVVDDAAKTCRTLKVPCDTHVLRGSPVKEILRRAELDHADLIIVGSHGWGRTGRLLLGSTADGVKQHASCSVLIAKQPPPARDLILAIDGSPLSRRATAFGVRLARHENAKAHLLHVVPVSPYATERDVRRAVTERVKEVHLLKWKRPFLDVDVKVGPEVDAILRQARALKTNLVILGSRGWGGLRSTVAGGVSNGVSHRANASVLLVKEASA